VPSAAISKRPMWRSSAPVKAPRSWPKSSEAINVPGSAAQLTVISGPVARGDCLWIARAISSLPVPVSPRTSTVASVAATIWTLARTSRNTGDAPTISSNMPCVSTVSRNTTISCASRSRRRLISSYAMALPTAMATGGVISSRLRASASSRAGGAWRA
jgi:hypothetical protein